MILTLNFVFLRLQGGLNQRLLNHTWNNFWIRGKGGEHHKLGNHSRLRNRCTACSVQGPGIDVTFSIPNQINLPLERNGNIDKNSATFIPLCRVLCIEAFDRLIFLKPNSFKNQNFYLASFTGVHCQTGPA